MLTGKQFTVLSLYFFYFSFTGAGVRVYRLLDKKKTKKKNIRAFARAARAEQEGEESLGRIRSGFSEKKGIKKNKTKQNRIYMRE